MVDQALDHFTHSLSWAMVDEEFSGSEGKAGLLQDWVGSSAVKALSSCCGAEAWRGPGIGQLDLQWVQDREGLFKSCCLLSLTGMG